MPDSANQAVFLSYASQDAEAARRMCEALRAVGVEVWFDQNELVGGDAWDAKIRGQISSCALFVPLISANTQARLEGYFRLEWKLAAQRALGIASGVPFILPVVIDDTREPDALVPDRFRMVQWTKLRSGEVPSEVQQRFLKLWSHRTGVLKHEAGGRGTGVPPVSGNHGQDARATAAAEPSGQPGTKNRVLVAAAALCLLGGVGWWLLGGRSKPPAPVAAPVASRAAPAAEFPRDPDLKRVYKLLYNVVDGIAEDFALMDDLVKPLLAARPNDPEVVTVAAGLAKEFVTRGFDDSPTRRAQAQRLSERAVQLAPENPEALATLGHYLFSTRTQLGRAEELLRRVIELNPKEPRYYCFLYSVLTASNKPAAEIDAFGVRMAALFPDYAMAPYMIAGHYTKISDFAAAEEWFDKSLALAPVPSAITSKAQIMLEVHGDVEGMKRWLERMPDRQRTNARMANTYAVLATVTGQTGPARRLLESIGDTWLADGTYLFPKALLGGELDQLDGNDDLARLQFEAALKEIRSKQAADPTDLRPIRAELWVQVGLGHREEARAALRLNLQRRPTPYNWTMNFTWWTSALRACLLLDERAQALTLLKEACAEPTGRLLLRNLFRVDPKMAPFRNDPEILALLAEPAAPKAGDGGQASAIKPAGDDKSVAVLAFENRSDDKANEYFSDGIADELLTTLQKIPGLKVSAHTSAWSFKGKNATSQEIGEKLHVANIVEGSVQKSGNRVKITARLSRAATNEEVWSKSFGPLELTDVFATQSEIAQRIVAQLRGKLMGEAAATVEIQAQVQAAERGGTRSVAAHERYLRGKFFVNQASVKNMRQAEALFQQAVELDPQFAQAWAAWSSGASYRADNAETRAETDEALSTARRTADRALAVEPNLAATQLARYDVQRANFDWNGAAESLRLAEKLAPGDAEVLSRATRTAQYCGQLETAIELGRQAVALDPVNSTRRFDLGLVLRSARRFAEAEVEFRRQDELSGGRSGSHLVSVNFALQGRFDEAAAEARLTQAEWTRYALAIAQWGQKKPAESDATLARLIEATADTAAYQIAQVYAFRQEAHRTFEWLERAYRQRDPGLTQLRLDLLFESLHADPRWPAFLNKIGLSDEQLK